MHCVPVCCKRIFLYSILYSIGAAVLKCIAISHCLVVVVVVIVVVVTIIVAIVITVFAAGTGRFLAPGV